MLLLLIPLYFIAFIFGLLLPKNSVSRVQNVSLWVIAITIAITLLSFQQIGNQPGGVFGAIGIIVLLGPLFAIALGLIFGLRVKILFSNDKLSSIVILFIVIVIPIGAITYHRP